MQLAAVAHAERAAAPLHATVRVRAIGIAVNVSAADAIDEVRADLDRALRQRGVQELHILRAGEQRRLHVERVHRDIVNRDFVARMRRINETEMITHLIRTSGNLHELRREVIRGRSGVGKPAAHAADE